MPQIFVLPRQQALDDDASPLAGALLYFFRTGTTTPQAVYADAALTTQHSHPIVADSGGVFAKVYLDPNAAFAYRVRLTTSAGVQLYQEDDIERFTLTAAEIASSLYPQTAAEQAAAITPSNYIYAPGDLRRYGVVGDGITNDTAALQRALTLGGKLQSPSGMTYLIVSALTASVAKTSLDLGNSTIKISAAYTDSVNLRPITFFAADCEVRNANFDATGLTIRSDDNTFIRFASGAHRGRVYCSRFNALPSPGANLNCAVSFLTGADDGEVFACSFNDCPGSVFSQGARVRIISCLSTSPKDVSYALNSTNCYAGSIIGCKVYSGDTIVSGHIAIEEGASDWIIDGCYVHGVKNGFGIAEVRVAVTTVVNGGIISNCIIDGNGFTTTGASALLSVSQYTRGCRIVNNILRGMPAGLSSNSAITLPALHTLLQGNRIDCTSGASSVGAVVITPAGGPIDIIDNYTDCTGGPSRHYVFNSGSNSNFRSFFKGGSFIGGTDAINTALNAPTNMPLWFENLTQSTATNVINLDGTDSLETFFNTHNAITMPHSIKTRRWCYGNAAPTQGTWVEGDCVMMIAPTASNPPGWVCVTAGSPGTWKAMANVAA